MNIIKDKTGVYVELPKDSIKFESKEAEIMYDLTLENDRLQQELQRKDNIINELKDYLKANIEVCDNRLSSPFCNFEKATKERLIFSNCLDKIKELEKSK